MSDTIAELRAQTLHDPLREIITEILDNNPGGLFQHDLRSKIIEKMDMTLDDVLAIMKHDHILSMSREGKAATFPKYQLIKE